MTRVLVVEDEESISEALSFLLSREGYEVSVRIGKKAFDGMNAAPDAKVWATDCPLAATQFGQHAGRRPLHPMTILARAYRPDGFPTPITTPTADSETAP